MATPPMKSNSYSMTATEFCRIGEALYGEYWRSTMSEKLVRDIRTIRRWGSGESPVPDVVSKKLRRWAARRGIVFNPGDNQQGQPTETRPQ